MSFRFSTGGVVRSFAGSVLGAVVALVIVFLAATAFREGTMAAGTTPDRSCGPEVILSHIPGNVDVTINDVVYHRPEGVEQWSLTFTDEDGIFTVFFHNGTDQHGSTEYDVGPPVDCETTTTTSSIPTSTTTTSSSSTTSTTTSTTTGTLPATG